MPGFWVDTSKIEELYLQYVDKVEECFLNFKKLIEMYIEMGETKEINSLAE